MVLIKDEKKFVNLFGKYLNNILNATIIIPKHSTSKTGWDMIIKTNLIIGVEAKYFKGPSNQVFNLLYSLITDRKVDGEIVNEIWWVMNSSRNTKGYRKAISEFTYFLYLIEQIGKYKFMWDPAFNKIKFVWIYIRGEFYCLTPKNLYQISSHWSSIKKSDWKEYCNGGKIESNEKAKLLESYILPKTKKYSFENINKFEN